MITKSENKGAKYGEATVIDQKSVSGKNVLVKREWTSYPTIPCYTCSVDGIIKLVTEMPEDMARWVATAIME